MLDPILKQSIQRWENEGGLYPALRSQTFEEIAWNKSYRSRNEINRDQSGHFGRRQQNRAANTGAKSDGMNPAKGSAGKSINQLNGRL